MIRADKIKARRKQAPEIAAPPPDFRALFDAGPDPCLAVDRDLKIVAVNAAYLRATMTTREDLVGRGVFEIFTQNPDDPDGTGPANLSASLTDVFKTGTTDTMAVQRYDIRVPESDGGGYQERYWNAINVPVVGQDGRVLYVIHRVQDITGFVQLKQERSEAKKISEEYRSRTEAEMFAISRQVAEANRELKQTVDALHESQQLFTSFMAKLPAAAWIKDLQGRYVFANAAMEQLFNIPVAAILGKEGPDVFPPELAAQFADSDRRVLREGTSNFQAVRQAGEGERYLMITKFAISRMDGSPEYIAGLAFDVTEAKQMEAEIERLASYPILSPSPVLEVTEAGDVVFCNPAAKAVLEEAGCCDQAKNPFIPEDVTSIFEELRSGKGGDHFREVAVDGRIFEELFTLAPQSSALRCYTMDITRRKRAEEEREQVLLKLEAVLDSISEGVAISDLEGNVVSMNREALALHDYHNLAEVRRQMSELQETLEVTDFAGRPVQVQDWPLTRAVHGESFRDRELHITNKQTGRSWICSYSGGPVRNKDGRQILAVVSLRDITEKKEMEEEIAKLNADLAARVSELEAFNEELEAFNRMVSHDLRQPLNTIATSCQAVEMLCGGCLDADCKQYVRIAYDKVRAMNELIGTLLAFSRSTHAELNRRPVNLSEIARNVAAEVRLAAPSRHVTFSIAEDLTAHGDANLLRSVLENLIGNAWKYTGNTEEAVIEFGADDVGGEKTFFVRDNGSGFSMTDAATVFTPFKRLPGAEHFAGFGVGLATVDRIIRRHGGRIWAEGEPGKGATFYFTLPEAQ